MAVVNFKKLSTSGFDEDALTTTTPGEHLLNFGALTTTGDLANGIFASANDVTVRNFGDIETAGLGAAGIYVQGDNARIENYGSVHTTGDFTEDELYFSEGLFAEGNGFLHCQFRHHSDRGFVRNRPGRGWRRRRRCQLRSGG